MADIREVVRGCFTDIVMRGDLAAADELLAKDVTFTTANGAVLRGRQEFKTFAETFRGAFPDIRFELEEEVTEGDRVCTRYLMRGTFLGPTWASSRTGASSRFAASIRSAS